MIKDYRLCILHEITCDVECDCMECPYCSDKDKEWLRKQDEDS